MCGLGGPKFRASVPSFGGIKCLTLLTQPCVYPLGSSTELWGLEFLLGFHYLGMVDRILGHVLELSLQASPLLERPYLITWSVFLVISPILSHSIS